MWGGFRFLHVWGSAHLGCSPGAGLPGGWLHHRCLIGLSGVLIHGPRFLLDLLPHLRPEACDSAVGEGCFILLEQVREEVQVEKCFACDEQATVWVGGFESIHPHESAQQVVGSCDDDVVVLAEMMVAMWFSIQIGLTTDM